VVRLKLWIMRVRALVICTGWASAPCWSRKRGIGQIWIQRCLTRHYQGRRRVRRVRCGHRMRQAIALPRRHVLASRKCFEVGKDKVSFAKLTMHMIPKIYESMRCTCFNCSHADIQIRHRLVRGQSIHNGLEFTLERGNPCYQYSQIHGNVYDCHPITPFSPNH
jgi:hypothetical protein